MAESESKGRIRTMTLTRPQWEVAEKIRQRLEDAAPWIEARNERVRAARTRYERPLSSATRVLPLDAPPGFADVDQERLDRAVLIDGHRGEGKTSVLMKLLDTWNQEALRSLRGDPPLRAPKKKSKNAKDSARDSRESREDFTVTLPERVFVVSLPTLDLPAMPRGQDVPLASLVLNCFSSLVAELVDDARRTGRGPGDHGSSHSHSERHDRDDRATEPLRDCWDWLHRSLASKYAHASKRNKDDLLQYAREVQDDTRRVYEIDDRFRLFVDALSAAVQRYFRTDKLPVFVVAIDDLDLAAHATIDLLDVLRVFQHPAVFFLMTGDYENLHRCVRNAPSMQALFNTNDGEREVQFGRSALASDVIERIFPRDNVCKLTPPTLDERLGVRWRDDRTVRDLLVELGPTVPLFASVAKDDERAKQRISRALPSQLRRLINLCHRLEGLAQREHSAVDVANEFWRAALADRGLEFPSGAIRSVFELRLDDKGDRRLCVMDVDAASGVGPNALVIERSGKRFELSTDRELIKTLTVVDEQKKPALPELVPVLSIVLEMSALGTNTRENGLPWFVNETLVRTTFARDRSVYTFDWPAPVMDTTQFARLRTAWARWLEHPYIVAALRDEKLSVLELYVMVLGFVCEGDKRGWKDLPATLPTTMARAESLPLIHAARDAAWQRVTEIEASSDPLDPFGQWVIEFVPRLATASAYDTATSDRGAGVVRTIARSKRRQSLKQRFEPTWFTRSGAEWLETSAFLLDDHWETTVEVVTKEGYKFFEKSVLLSPTVCAPIESMTIDQYLSLESRKGLRRRIDEALEDRALLMKLESLQQRPGIHSLLTQIALIGAKLGERIDPTIPSLPENYAAVSDSYSLEVLWSGSYVFSEVPSYLAIEGRDPFAAFVADLWIDTALILPADSNESIAGANLWLATRPVWIAPVFGSPFDQQLLAEGWNQVIRAERTRSERVLAGWLSVCDETYRSRTIDDASYLPLSFDVPTAFARSASTLSIRASQYRSFLQSLPLFTTEYFALSREARASLSQQCATLGLGTSVEAQAQNLLEQVSAWLSRTKRETRGRASASSESVVHPTTPKYPK